LSLDASYIGDNVNNLSGGINTGSLYSGMANLRVALNSEDVRFWKGGRLFINAANTHGSEPSARLTGDFQVLSNIEAGNHTYLQELWYSQVFGPLEIIAGLQDLNIEFANTGNGSLFLNSSFGILPTISCNVPAPIFPLTSLGLAIKWQITEKTTWLAAIFDGAPTDFEKNPYNVSWDLNSDDGTIVISEMQYSTHLNSNPGTYKFGLFTHHHYTKQDNDPETPEIPYKTNYGLYVIADQILWHDVSGSKNLGMFIQLGISPAHINQNYYYAGFGLNYSGLINKQGGDALGLAIAHAGLKGDTGRETTVELTWNIPLTKQIFIQPDFQYIINPAGTGEKLDNCLAAIFRFGFIF
jgi:porin